MAACGTFKHCVSTGQIRPEQGFCFSEIRLHGAIHEGFLFSTANSADQSSAAVYADAMGNIVATFDGNSCFHSAIYGIIETEKREEHRE